MFGEGGDKVRRKQPPSSVNSKIIGFFFEMCHCTRLSSMEAFIRAREFEIAWYADPVYKTGDYPASMRAQLGDRLPKFTPEESKLALGSSDFYGMNSYTSFFVKHKTALPHIDDHSGNIEKLDTNKQGVERGPASDTYWLKIAPWGFRKLLNWIWKLRPRTIHRHKHILIPARICVCRCRR